ncbi:MAG: Uma2 family endonuclease [Chloroflexota bacterium]
MVDQLSTRITAEAFRKLPESTEPTELIDGAVTVSPSPVSQHQRLVGRIYALLLGLCPPGEPMVAPMDVYLDDDNVFQPDVFWRATDSQCVEREGYFYGAPELIVEVHSPATTKTDKQKKVQHL